MLVHGAQIAGVHPAGGVDGLRSPFGVIPIAQHDVVTTGQNFAGLARLHDAPVGINNFGFHVGQGPPHRAHFAFHGVIHRRLKADRRGFRHAIGNGDLRHIHFIDHLLHHLDRAGRAGHDAGAQGGKVKAVELWVVQGSDEHGRHAV